MQTDYTQKDVKKFWGYVDKERSNVYYNGSRCWEWTKALSYNGYGFVKMGGNTMPQLAKEFGVTKQTIFYVVRRRA